MPTSLNSADMPNSAVSIGRTAGISSGNTDANHTPNPPFVTSSRFHTLWGERTTH